MVDELVKAKFKGSPTRCPYCHDQVDTVADPWVACADCLSRHHSACWAEASCCGSCQGQRRLVATQEALPDPEHLRRLFSEGLLDEAVLELTRAGLSRESALEHLLRLLMEERAGRALLFGVPPWLEALGLLAAGAACLDNGPAAGTLFVGLPVVLAASVFWLGLSLLHSNQRVRQRAALALLWPIMIALTAGATIAIFDIGGYDRTGAAVLFFQSLLFAAIRARSGLRALREGRVLSSQQSSARTPAGIEPRMKNDD